MSESIIACPKFEGGNSSALTINWDNQESIIVTVSRVNTVYRSTKTLTNNHDFVNLIVMSAVGGCPSSLFLNNEGPTQRCEWTDDGELMYCEASLTNYKNVNYTVYNGRYTYLSITGL